MTTKEILIGAKNAKHSLSGISTDKKNAVLKEMAKELSSATDEILAANLVDVEKSRGVISDVMIDRLSLSKSA